MPLRFKCSHCSKELLLDEAFCGAGCRCQFCREYMRVPARPALGAARASRPARPRLTSEISSAASKTRQVSGAASAKSRVGRHSFRKHPRLVVAALLILAVAATSLTAYTFVGRSRDLNDRRYFADATPDGATADNTSAASTRSRLATNAGNLHDSFFGIVVDGNVVAYVVDGDPAMAPYIEQFSTVANFVNQSIKTETRRYGVVRPSQKQRFSLLDVAQRTPMLDGGETTLSPQLPSEGTDLGQCLATASNWYADQIFMILAKPLSPAELDALAAGAEQTGAKTHVIAVGPAAEQDLSKIADATGGSFIQLSDADLADWTQQYQAATKS